MANKLLKPVAFKLLPTMWFFNRPNNAGAAKAVKPLMPLVASAGAPAMCAICSPKPLALSPNNEPKILPPYSPNECTPDSLANKFGKF